MSSRSVVRDEADGFEFEELAFGARHKDEADLLFVIEAVNEQVARDRAEEIARKFFDLNGDALVLVPLDRAVNAVPNFLASFFRSSVGDSCGTTNAFAEPRTLH